ncbi:MAG: peptidase S13 [Deltaproteobacteria bacterium]|nr:MAG: peptidase S13 [Deltaproteobacteria bacterium]
MAAIRIIYLTLFCWAITQAALAGQTRLVENGGYLIAQGSKIIESYNQDQPFIPASTLKVLTSLMALERLGEDYRFTTSFYLDKQRNLWIKGGGDPFLTSENINLIAIALKKKGIDSINHLVLDNSLYQLEGPVDGTEYSLNPYDADNGALAVNFNTLPILVRKNGVISSAEPQTPILPMMRKLGKGLGLGRHIVNVCAAEFAGQLPHPQLQYAGELFRIFLIKNGVVVSGSLKSGKYPGAGKQVLEYKSAKNLKEILRAGLKSSNNFIANQIFLQMGIKAYGPPATWEKSRQYTRHYLRKNFVFTGKTPIIMEGSGLSRNNRLSAGQMLQILKRFAPYAKDILPKKHQIYVKSGTMKGVYCYAGYIPDKNMAPVVILLNQKKNNRDAVLQHLKKQVK